MTATFIVATDMSMRSDRALRRAVRLARDREARLVILAVVDDATPLDIAEGHIEKTRESLEDFVAGISGDLDCDLRVSHGDPTADIIGTAERERADLLILGTHRPRSFLDALRETTAQRITRLTACPVLLVTGTESTSYDEVMLATDFSPAASAAAALTRTLLPGARLTPLHALHVPYQGMLAHKAGASEIETSFRAEAEREDYGWRAGDPLVGTLPETRIVTGSSPLAVFEAHVAKTGTGLIAIGAHGRVGQRRAVLGSVVTDLMRAPPCDLLICRPASG